MQIQGHVSLLLQDFSEPLVSQYGLQFSKNKRSLASISQPYLYTESSVPWNIILETLASLKDGYRSDPQREHVAWEEKRAEDETWETLGMSCSKSLKRTNSALFWFLILIFCPNESYMLPQEQIKSCLKFHHLLGHIMCFSQLYVCSHISKISFNS